MRFQASLALALALALALGAACGGETTDGDGDGGGGRESPESDGGTPVAEDARKSDFVDAGTGLPLPGCEPGFDPDDASGRPCNWVAKGQCYEKKLEACACVCPREATEASNCSSGFPSEDGEVEVYCY